MYPQESLAQIPFAFHLDGRLELHAAITTLAARFVAAMRQHADRELTDAIVPGTRIRPVHAA
jgi:hypothetical protein